ncbi:MAG: diaminopimelate decarboxylase [Promethearchaeota archaeon]|nr:MAG: diaminopimelate decarboxylase [Candidatus Lokiarchaeota archaeon]
MEYQKWLKRKELEYIDKKLHFSNLNVQELGNEYGTPVYITSERIIRKRFDQIDNVLKSTLNDYNIHYAVKANSNLSILTILHSQGSYFDCTSQGEIYCCLRAGIPSDKMIYTGNMFTDEDFKFAIENEVIINLDSLSQLYRVNQIYESLKVDKKIISFRYNPEFGAGHHAHDITAGKEVKFGILDNQIIEAYQKAKNLGFRQFGIHIHIGSGITNVMNYQRAIDKYLSIIEEISNHVGLEFKFVDFGGGFGIPYHPDEELFNFEKYKELVLIPFINLVESSDIGDPTLKIEPGRFLTAESTIIATKINTIKDNGYKKFVGVDAGFNTLIRPILYDSYHHIIPCFKPKKAKTVKYDIVGPICESGDVLGKNREIAEVDEKEYLAILDAGAYGYTMSSSYNSRPRPAEILISKGKSYLIRKAETYEDLLRTQTIPNHLK